MSKRVTLEEVFTPARASLQDPKSPDRKTLLDKFRQHLPGVNWVASKYDLVGKVAEILHIDLPETLIAFWKKSDEITAALRKSEETPAETIDVGLAEHTIDATLHPELEISVGQAPKLVTYTIPFALELKCAVTGVVLKIQNGEILSVDRGSCQLSGELKLGDLVLATAPREGGETVPLGSEAETEEVAAV